MNKPPSDYEIAQTDREIRQQKLWRMWGFAVWWFCVGAMVGVLFGDMYRGWTQAVFIVFGIIGTVCLVIASGTGWYLHILRRGVHSGPRVRHEHICKTCLEKSLAGGHGAFRQECSNYDCKIPEDVDSCSECSNANQELGRV